MRSLPALVMLVPAVAAVAQAPEANRTESSRLVGWVSDGHCTTTHMKEGGEACVRKCIAGATHVNPEWKPGGMVFVTEDQKVWKVDNPDALWGHESRRVEVDADVNRQRESIRVVKFIRLKPAQQ